MTWPAKIAKSVKARDAISTNPKRPSNVPQITHIARTAAGPVALRFTAMFLKNSTQDLPRRQGKFVSITLLPGLAYVVEEPIHRGRGTD